jgi:hypothetical protein
MSYLHLHSWAEDADGNLVEEEHDVAVTGQARVQVMTEGGFKSFEMGTEATGGVQAVELMDGDVPEVVAAAKAEAKATSSSSSS